MKQHTHWLRDHINAIPSLTGRVYLTGEVPQGAATPFVVVHPSDGSDEQDRLTGPSGLMQPRFTIHTVGRVYDEVATFAGRIKAALTPDGFGIVPTIPGEKSHRVWWDSPVAIQRDTDTTPARLYHVAECGFASQKTSQP